MTIYSLLQAIAQDPQASGLIPYGAGLIVVGTMGWVIKTTREVAATLTRLDQYLFGLKGTNGLDSKVKRIEADVDFLLERRVAPADRRPAE